MVEKEIDYDQFPDLDPNDFQDQFRVAPVETPSENPEEVKPIESVITEAAKPEAPKPVETPAIEQVIPGQVTQEAPVDNSKQILADIFGEDVDTTAAKERVRLLKEENERLTALATGSSQANSQSEKAARFNAFIAATGSEDYQLFTQLEGVKEDTDPIDILLMEKRISAKGNWNPQLEQALRDQLVQRYKQDSDVFSETEVALGKYELQEALSASVQKLSSIREKIEAAKPVNTLEIYNQAKQTWQPHIEEIRSNPEAAKINLKFTGMGDQKFKVGDKEVEIPVVYDIPKATVQQLTSEALEIASRNGLQYDDKTRQGIIDYVRSRSLQENFNEIVSKAIQVAIERVNEVRDAQVHNPSALNPAFSAERKENAPSQEEDVYDMIAKAEGWI